MKMLSGKKLSMSCKFSFYYEAVKRSKMTYLLKSIITNIVLLKLLVNKIG